MEKSYCLCPCIWLLEEATPINLTSVVFFEPLMGGKPIILIGIKAHTVAAVYSTFTPAKSAKLSLSRPLGSQMRLSTRPLLSTKQLPTKTQTTTPYESRDRWELCFGDRKYCKKRLSKSRRCELGAHVVAGLLQWRDCGITKSRDQITRRAEDGCPFVLKAGCFPPSKRARPSWSHCAESALEGKVGRRRAEDGHHKMGAHEAGRVACHASSPEWAVKSATCTFLSIETVIFLRLL